MRSRDIRLRIERLELRRQHLVLMLAKRPDRIPLLRIEIIGEAIAIWGKLLAFLEAIKR